VQITQFPLKIAPNKEMAYSAVELDSYELTNGKEHEI
jgi:hypothetical protein